MSPRFKMPDFGDRCIELRCEDNEVCIYANRPGLEKLMAFCKDLLDKPRKGHIHLEDHEVLTASSLRGTIALFDTEN